MELEGGEMKWNLGMKALEKQMFYSILDSSIYKMRDFRQIVLLYSTSASVYSGEWSADHQNYSE